jgi:hypothetical protein
MDDMAKYEELADAAERGELKPVPGTALHGAAAVAEGRRMLMAATGSTNIREATRVALGRPRLDAAHGPTPVWRVRAPETLDEQVRALAAQRHVPLSQVVRDAVAAYVQAS